MISLDVVDTDAFLEMPTSTQNLYFHLSVRADDDGFLSSPRKITRTIGANEDDLKLLFAKKFLINFNGGICVIKHWRMNNFIAKDRYTETKYINLKRTLFIRKNGAYTLNDNGQAVRVPDGHFTLDKLIVNDSSTICEPSIGKVSKVKVSEDKERLVKDTQFDTFWQEYPVKKEKKKTREKFMKLTVEIQQTIIADVKKRKDLDSQWKRGYVPHPTTYLNGERWEDEIDSRDLGKKPDKSVSMV